MKYKNVTFEKKIKNIISQFMYFVMWKQRNYSLFA